MKTMVLLAGILALTVTAAGAQEVVITGFPLGVGATIEQKFFEPYFPQLQSVADQIALDPLAHAIVVGQADGARYVTDNDAKNPGLSLGRAHALRNVLVRHFGVDSTRVFIQSADVPARGDQYRSVSVRVETLPADTDRQVEEVLPAVVVSEPVTTEPAPVTVTENNNYFSDQMALRLSAGVSSSPFGGLPMVSGAVIWKHTVSFEFVLGHTFWSDTYQFQGNSLSTWQRMVSGRITVYPWQDKPIGFIGGWSRIEEIAQSYYEYVRLSEGPVLGVGFNPFKHLSLTGLYNPSRQRLEGFDISSAKNGQFLLSISVFTDLGGGR